MTRNEMVEALYHMMKDVMSPGSARALAERTMKHIEANGLPEAEVVAPVEAVAEVVPELPVGNVEDPVAEVTATVMKAAAKKSKKES